MKAVYSNRNVLVISVTSSIIMFFVQVYNPFWSLYLGELGFSIPQIGLLSAIQSSEQFLFQLPGGMLADRIGRKKVTLIVAAVRIFAPILFLFSTSLEGILIASLLTGFESIGGPAFQAIVAESLPREQLGAGYGVFNAIQRVPAVLTGILGGVLMDALGVSTGTRLCFIGASIAAAIVFLARYLFITETLHTEHKTNSNVKKDITEVIPLLKGTLFGMLIASAVTQFAARLIMSYTVIYVVEIIGLTKTEWGIITTIMSLLNLLTSLPSGMMSDRYDKRKLLAFTRAIEPISTFGYIILRGFWPILTVRVIAGVGMGLSGGNVMGFLGGPAWSSLIADLVPREKRGRLIGLMGTISGLTAFSAPYIGAYTWESGATGPDNTLLMSGILGLFSSVIIWLFVRDPRFEAKNGKR